jgi:glycosyltransferase involved in cell wall biosynthesis
MRDDAKPAPRVAYVLLWFPRASETFVFREVCALREMGLPMYIYTLYGARLRGCSDRMRAYDGPMVRFGAAAIGKIAAAFFRETLRRPRFVLGLMRRCLLRRMRNIETLGENVWSFFAGFAVARLCLRDGIELLHSPWANGPCTTAWVASLLTGIPFSFTGRAGDMYPQDGLLAEKLESCLFVRTNTAANVKYLASHMPKGREEKIILVYNALTLPKEFPGHTPGGPPYRLLAVGRFAGTKGFSYLLTAMARLRRESFPCRLTLVGDGWLRPVLRSLRARLRLEDCVEMPGFVPHDRMPGLMKSHHMLLAPCVVTKSGDRDGIPNVIIEALSQGLPVIATGVSGIGEVVRHERTGFVVEQRDAAALSRAVKKMAADGARAERMAAEGNHLVRSMFDPRANIQRLYSLYVDSLAAFARREDGGRRPSGSA